ncbi:hypothetical protein OSTOST_21503, partial [Ostertagia ostertagi]
SASATKYGTTPAAAERTTESQAETERPGVRELSTTAEMPELEAKTTTEGANLRVSTLHIPSPPDSSASATKSIVFLLDASSAALGEAWKNMVELVVRTVGELKQPRVAAVAMSCPSEILLQMDTYTPSQLRKDLLAYHPAGGEVATAQAYGLARDLLNAETAKDKSVVVFSNGQTSTCNISSAGNEDERAVANKVIYAQPLNDRKSLFVEC